MKSLQILIFVIVMGIATSVASAQEGDGQLCVRAFEDRNRNSVLDPNEPPITQGLGVNLMNSQSVTISSKLLSDSPTAAQGVVCFQQLVAGDYMVAVTSADYDAVTDTLFNAMIVPGSVPTRFDYGAELIATGAITSSASGVAQVDEGQALQGILFGILGALIIMGIMVIAGMMIYFGVFRRRMSNILALEGTGAYRPVTGPMQPYNPGTGPMQPYNPGTGPQPAYNPGTGPQPAYQSTPPTTGSTPAVDASNPLLTRDPNEGSPPLFSEEDTDQMGSIKD